MSTVPDEYRLDEMELEHLQCLLAHRRATRAPVTADECAHIRERARAGQPCAGIAADEGRHPDTIERHATGNCECNVDEPPARK